MPGLLDYIPSQSDVQRTLADLLAGPRNRLADLMPRGLLGAARQYISDAAPGGALNREWTPENVRTAGEVASMMPNPAGDVISGLLAVDDLRKGDYGSAALNSLGLVPFVPAMAGMLRGSGSKFLTQEQLLEINKGRGLLSKADRKALYDPSSGAGMSQQLGDLGILNKEIQDVRNARNVTKNTPDPLELLNHQRKILAERGLTGATIDIYKSTPANLEQSFESAFRYGAKLKHAESIKAKQQALEEATRTVFAAPSSDKWHKNIADKIRNEIDFQILMGNKYPHRSAEIDQLGKSATLEAITREAKKRGMQVDYVSAKSSHAGGSHYIKTPDGKVVRVSDHELPETPQRTFNRSQGLNGRWDDEIILDDWRESSIDAYINRILGKE